MRIKEKHQCFSYTKRDFSRRSGPPAFLISNSKLKRLNSWGAWPRGQGLPSSAHRIKAPSQAQQAKNIGVLTTVPPAHWQGRGPMLGKGTEKTETTTPTQLPEQWFTGIAQGKSLHQEQRVLKLSPKELTFLETECEDQVQ